MNDWLIWNGVRSTDMGVFVSEPPPITIPEERAEFSTVRGRSGSVVRLEGEQIYNDMILSARCFVKDASVIPAAAAWLQGSGEVEFCNRPGGRYRARIVNQMELTRVLAGNPHHSFAVNFRCQPGWLHNDSNALAPITVSGTAIHNPGTLASLPRIAIAGSGTFSLTIGMQTAWLKDIDGGIILDSLLGDALTLDGAALLNGRWGGPILTIPPGDSFVSWLCEDSGSVDSVTILPRWMSL